MNIKENKQIQTVPPSQSRPKIYPDCTKNPAVFALNVNPLYDDKLFAGALECLPEYRKQKIERLYFRKDKNLSLGAGLLLEYALKQAGLPKKSEIITSENGKPYLKDENFFFSLSHSGNFAACAVSSFEIGCDIEYRKEVNFDIAKRFFTRDEYDDIISSGEKNEKFYRYWTLKESFMKATGQGMKLPLDSFCITLEKPPYVKSETVKEKYFFKEFLALSDFACSVCGTKDCSGATFTLLSDIKKIISEISDTKI